MSTKRPSRGRQTLAVFAASGIALAGSVALLAPSVSSASSHREAPLIANDPQADNTDTYAFVSPDRPDMVTLIANWIPFENPAGGPNFYPWSTDASYNIKIDTNGDAIPDVTYTWKFKSQDTRGTVQHGDKAGGSFLYNDGPVNHLSDKTLLFKQTYTLYENGKKLGTGKVAPSNVGAASMPNYASLRAQAVTKIGGYPSYAGQADDPFFLDLRVFDLLYGANLSEAGHDGLSGYNVNSVALQVPIKELTKGGDPVIGVWSTTDRPGTRLSKPDGSVAYSGKDVQVSRLGAPLVNEVVVPAQLKDAFNALPPVADHTVQPVVDKVLDPEVPKLIQAIYGIKAPAAPRTDLQAIFLTGLKGLNMPKKVTAAEMLRLNTSIKPTSNPNRLGVLAGDFAGYPNGRRLTDDVVDITLQAAEGAVSVDKNGAPTGVNIVKPLAAGDGVNANDVAFGQAFPYLALPHSGSGAANGLRPSGAMGTGGGGLAVDQTSTRNPVLPVSAGLAGLVLAGVGVMMVRRNRAKALR